MSTPLAKLTDDRAATLRTLYCARERIAAPDSWIKGHTAEDLHGNECRAAASYACRWCPLGAVYAEGTRTFREVLEAALDHLEATIPDGRHVTVPGFNDAATTEHGDVLAWFDRAIKQAEARA